MNLFTHELKAQYKSTLIWSFSIVVLIILGINEFSSLSSSPESLQQIMDSIPDSMKAVMGMSDADVSTANGYYSVLFFYFLLMAAVHASMLGSKRISIEEIDKTVEFLYTKPISRIKIVLIKTYAAITNLIIINIVLILSTYLFFLKSNENMDKSSVLLMGITFFLFQMMFLSFGMMVASIGSSKGAPIRATLFVFVTYLLSVLVELSEKLEFLIYFTPFKYFPVNEILEGNRIEPIYVIISIIFSIICFTVCIISYKRRDLNI